MDGHLGRERLDHSSPVKPSVSTLCLSGIRPVGCGCSHRVGLSSVGVLLSLAAGCMVGPNYHSPTPAVPSSYYEINPIGTTNQNSRVIARAEIMERWWTTFQDPELNSLIHRAIQGNRDLRLDRAGATRHEETHGLCVRGSIDAEPRTGSRNAEAVGSILGNLVDHIQV